MANRGTLSERIVQARNKGVPSILANFSKLMTSSADSLAPVLLVATGDVLRDADRLQIPAFTTWNARPLLAEVIAQSWATTHGSQDADQILARAYGELTGINNVRHQNQVINVTSSRAKIIRTLRQRCPPSLEFRSLIVDIIARCRNQDEDLADPEDCAIYVPNGLHVSNQTMTFYRLRGHLISNDIFITPASSQSWINLCDMNHAMTDLNAFDLTLIDDIPAVWRELPNDGLLGYYEAKAVQGIEKTRGILGGSIFSYLTTLAKESNITPAWIQRRRRQFEDRLPGVSFDSFISEPIVKHYVRMYTQPNAQWEDIYRQLVVCWSMLQSSEGSSLSWIIEQASNNNVTCVMTIADVITRLQFFDIDLIISKGIPRTNFVYAATQAGDLLRNPFCSLVKPTVNIRQYADLAYLCTHLKRDHIKDQAFSGYRGQASAMCARTESELKQIAMNLFRMSQDKTDTDMSVQALYKSRVIVEDADLHEIQDEIYVVPRLAQVQANADVNPFNAEAQAGHARSTRIGWPKLAMSLPAGTTRVTREQMYTRLEETASVEAKAFKLIMGRLYALQNQVPLATMPGNALDIPRPERVIPVDLRNALLVWGVNIPEEWTHPLDPYVPGAIAGEYPPQFASIPARQTINGIPNLHQPGINPQNPGLPGQGQQQIYQQGDDLEGAVGGIIDIDHHGVDDD